MPADAASGASHERRSGSRTPDTIRAAVEAGRGLLDRAEEYHTATYRHDALRADVPVIPTRPRISDIVVPAEVSMHRMCNFPLVPVATPQRSWIPQVSYMSAAARVGLIFNMKNRPSLTATTESEEWRLAVIAAAAMRAAAWDAVVWVPTHRTIQLVREAADGVRVVPDGLGRSVCEVLSGRGAPSFSDADLKLMHACYESWDKAFTLAHSMLSLPADVHPSSLAILGNVIQTSLGADKRFALFLTQEATMSVVMQSALTALPIEVWTAVRQALDNKMAEK